MLKHAVCFVRDPDIRRRIFVAAMLLSGGAPFTECAEVINHDVVVSEQCPSGQVFVENTGCQVPGDPEVHDPYFHAGATVSLRTPAAGDNGVTLFARTGVLAPIDASSSTPVPAVNGGPATTGTINLRENITVPLYGGVTVPAKNVGVPIPNLSFEAFAGADVKNEKFGFNLVGPPGVVAASQTYTTVNPALGAGIQYYLGTFSGLPTSLGAAYIVDMQLSSHSVTAPSPNISGLSYTLPDPNHISGTAVFTLNFDLSPK